ALFKDLEPGDEPVTELSEWNLMSRIDVVSTRLHPEQKKVFIDGDAWTQISSVFGELPTWNSREAMVVFRSPYLLRKYPDDVLVIGSGGGVDVWNALRARTPHIETVEVNPTTYRISLDDFRGANRDLFHHRGVFNFNEDGRSYVRRSNRRFDVIMLQGVDT